MIPEINIGMIGHIDHGKTSLLKSLTGKWASTHSEELKRGITIRLGYSSMIIYKCPNGEYTNKDFCPIHNKKTKAVRCVSFVDAPGHEMLMATMLSGAAVMDAAILVIAANEPCPQPQTREHLAALNIMGIKNIIIVQNKIDLVDDKRAMESYEEIKKFIKGSVAENAPIIPISALHDANLDILLEAIQEFFPTPKRNLNKKPLMLVSRSFDVNKPGTKPEEMVGGVLGGVLKCGELKVGDEIYILPGIKKDNKWVKIKTKIKTIFYDKETVEKAIPGGNFGISTLLDPSLTKNDSLAGNVVCTDENAIQVFYELKLKLNLIERVVGEKKEIKPPPIKINEPLMINAFTAKTIGIIEKMDKEGVLLKLKIPIAINPGERVAISRFINNKWRLVGSATVLPR